METTRRPLDDEIDLVELWGVLRDGFLIIVGTTVTAALLGIVISLLMTPVFRAEAVVAEADPTGNRNSGGILGQYSDLASLAGINLGNVAPVEASARNLLDSRTFVEEFIERNSLMPLIFAEEWNDSAEDWHQEIERIPALWEGAEKFKDQIFSVSTDSDTGLTTLSIEWSDPELAAAWANQLATMANEIARSKDILEAERSIAYLNEQISQTNVIELQQVLYNLLEIEQKNLMLANAREEYIYRVIDPAVIPYQRVRPQRTLMVIVATVAGGIFGIFAVFVIRFFKSLFNQSAARTKVTSTAVSKR